MSPSIFSSSSNDDDIANADNSNATMPSSLTSPENERLKRRLRAFVKRHTSNRVPIALVTSGGTMAPLEIEMVRYLDNFSTGTRGAISVELLLKRGYAVIHLRRIGSACPFGRVLAREMECDGPNGPPTFNSFGRLFDDPSGDYGHESDDGNDGGGDNKPRRRDRRRDIDRGDELALHPRLVDSTILISAHREYRRVCRDGSLLTVEYRSVDEYLEKLELCCIYAMRDSGHMGLVYLAAAVSDFHVPIECRAAHKIQSRDYGIAPSTTSSSSSSNANATSGRMEDDECCGSGGGDDGEMGGEAGRRGGGEAMRIGSDGTLLLTLHPVPKAIPRLRRLWCPEAYVVSFKLETDPSILRRKSVLAMENNDVHLVVGNVLSTRYERVYVLSRELDEENDDVVIREVDGESGMGSDPPSGWKYHVREIAADECTSSSSSSDGGGDGVDADALEYATIEYVTSCHFHHISTSMGHEVVAEITARRTPEARAANEGRSDGDNRRRLRREMLMRRASELAWNVVGSALGVALSYGIARMMHGRQQR